MSRSSTHKVFGIGLSKTANTSLAGALRTVGLTIKKFPKDFAEIQAYDGAIDTPVAADFERLDELYPGSKFILTTRPMSAWLKSCERMWRRRQSSFDRCDYISRLHERIFGVRQFDAECFTRAFQSHQSRVAAYFAERTGAPLVVDLTSAEDQWIGLAKFLDFTVPPVPFPHENAGDAVDALVVHIFRRTQDLTLTSELSGVPHAAIEELISSIPDARRSSDQLTIVDMGWEVRLVLNSAARRFGSCSAAYAALGLSVSLTES